MTGTTTMMNTMMEGRPVRGLVVVIIVRIIHHRRCRHCLLETHGWAFRLLAMVLSIRTRRGGPSLFLRFVFQFCLFALHSRPEWMGTGSECRAVRLIVHTFDVPDAGLRRPPHSLYHD